MLARIHSSKFVFSSLACTKAVSSSWKLLPSSRHVSHYYEDLNQGQNEHDQNYEHQREKFPHTRKIIHAAVGFSIVASMFNWREHVHAAESVKEDLDDVQYDETLPDKENIDAERSKSSIKEKSESSKSKKDDDKSKNKSETEENSGFRGKKLTEQIVEYENRIRQYSTPDKVFRYFATVKMSHVNGDCSEVFMTPDDFLRSITPGDKQPYGLGLDQYRKYEPKNGLIKLELALDEDSIFYKLGSSGLISFSDYVFLLTVLSTSRRHFEIAFRMFDLNGDGNVDYEEFDKVTTLIRQQTNIGTRHRDHANTGNCFKGVNSGLATYFFGKNRKGKLTIEKFLEFQQKLQNEILSLEYSRRTPLENGNISEIDFCDLLLVHAGYSERKKEKMLKRVSKSFKHSEMGVSLDDYLKFFHFLNNINDVELALEFYYLAGASVDQVTFKHVAKTVAHVDLSDHLVNVVFTLFDENLDGQLSYTEFVAVMKHRLLRGLEKPKDTKFIKVMQSLFKCALESKPILLSL